MELGNMVFGNSRGEFPLDRGEGFEEELNRLFDAYAPDRDNSWREYGIEFENDIFAVFPYYWGECTCGFDSCEFEEKHLDTCYQVELDIERQKAGAIVGRWGYLDFPNSWSYDKERKVEDKIYKELTTKHNLPMQGRAVHCTCDYEQRYETWLGEIGYPLGHKPDCLLVKPNFCYKPSDFQVQWYKYPLRDSYTNREITLREFRGMINNCIASLK